MHNLKLENITKKFGSITAVEDINITIEPDEVLCLLGPSGCGKTTTLRMIAGLETVSKGKVWFGDDEVSSLPAEKRNVAMAFQFYALYPDLTVSKNLAYPLDAEGLNAAETGERVDEIARTLQLEAVLDRYPHQLSEGEKQRVAVGRCIIRSPSAFLFDEPLSRLDVKLREEMRGSIRKILAKLDRPTVIVTHDQLEAMTMGDRIAVMRDGKIEQIGAPLSVFARPSNRFVASFIGTPQMNILDAIYLGKQGGRSRFQFGEIELDCEMPELEVELSPGTQFAIGFRPRSTRIGFVGTLQFKNAELFLTENMGAENLLHFKWGTFDLRLICDANTQPDVKQLGDISVAVEDILVFDQNEQRIKTKAEVS